MNNDTIDKYIRLACPSHALPEFPWERARQLFSLALAEWEWLLTDETNAYAVKTQVIAYSGYRELRHWLIFSPMSQLPYDEVVTSLPPGFCAPMGMSYLACSVPIAYMPTGEHFRLDVLLTGNIRVTDSSGHYHELDSFAYNKRSLAAVLRRLVEKTNA